MSHSSGHYSNRYGNSGSNYYQRKGFLGKLFGMLDSNSGHGYQNNYPQNQNFPNQTIACTKCNTQLPLGSKFCPQCGEKLGIALFCENCAEKINPDTKFCPKCGTKTNNVL
jgi:RNA polymerase subunit RPABC4/transcription elongation factor Spt4